MTIEITRWVEFDAGHRVATHGGKCRNAHGHRYVVGVTVSGIVPESGMIVDFGILSEVLAKRVHDVWDHRFLYDASDASFALLDAKGVLPGAVAVVGPPTAENLALWISDMVGDALGDDYDEALVTRVEVRETPKSVAVWTC